MFSDPARQRFTSMVTLRDEDIDLLVATLLIAQEEYPGLSVVDEVARVDAIAADLVGAVGKDADFFHAIFAINQALFEKRGFRGNLDDYEDPDNSMMNRVLDRRLGIPITLSILYLEVARRTGLSARGVGFPGHFIVRFDDTWGTTFVDPFHRGRILLEADLRRRLTRALGRETAWKAQFLAPANNRQILTRLLLNLKRLYVNRGDLERALAASERLVILNPHAPSERRDRGLLYGQTGHREVAIADLQEYLQLRPDASDARRIRRVLNGLLQRRSGEA